MTSHTQIKVIVFDTFGTVLDWRTSIIANLEAWGALQNRCVDWAHLTDLWRSQYEPLKEKVRQGTLPWTNLDDLHRLALREIGDEVGIQDFTDEELNYVNHTWHNLRPWDDVLPGLQRLKCKFVIGPLSNGNVSMLVDMAKFAELPWDMVFSCELVRKYKPHPDTYLSVSRLMCVRPEEVLMCAAHNEDLKGAQNAGLRTAFVGRPGEFGPARPDASTPTGNYDLICKDFIELAERMGA